MNKTVKHGSIEELQAMDAKEELSGMPPEERKQLRRELIQKMEECDPGGKRAHELAAKYH